MTEELQARYGKLKEEYSVLLGKMTDIESEKREYL